MFEISKVNCPKWNNEFEPKKIDAKFSFPAHHILGKFVLKLSPLLAGIFSCNLKTIKKIPADI